MSKRVYIKGVGCISPQQTFESENFLSELQENEEEYLSSIEPEYKQFISPIKLRRMSRIVKMGISSGLTALKDANIKTPDAIITGTGWGCLEDTGKFLTSIIENKEQMLTPTAFIQSTHNTVSAQIALLLKCIGYNYTYTNRGFSFENALIDAVCMLQENSAQNLLVGGIDEITPDYYNITKRVGWWKQEKTANRGLINSQTNGTLAGEGSAFFTLTSEKSSENYAEIKQLNTLYKPTGQELKVAISTTLADSELTMDDIDLVLLGNNGDIRFDSTYTDLADTVFNKQPIGYFKHLCGEYFTASSFGLWLAAKILKAQTIPSTVLSDNQVQRDSPKNILLYNHYANVNHAIYLLSTH